MECHVYCFRPIEKQSNRALCNKIGYSHSNEILPTITYVYNCQLLVYFVIITENINSKISFSIDNNFNNKFNVCHFKSIFPTR